MIHKITFECETITPMFLAGADGRTPELRAPSIKGALRFWWRAMNGHLPLEELRKKEASIFGGVGDKEGKSEISIIVSSKEDRNSFGSNLRSDLRLNWRFAGGKLQGPHAGIGYLLYSTILSNRERPYFKPPQNSRPGFQFILQFCALEKKFLIQTISAFWVLTFLGGLGTRSRRGGGNFIIKNVNDGNHLISELGIDFIPDQMDASAFVQWFLKNFQKVKNIINEKKPTDFVSEYSNLSISRFILSKDRFPDWIAALNDIGEKYQEFRFKHRSDIFDTGVFGLPIVHRRGRLKVQGKYNREQIKRRSSPLIFKIVRLEENLYYWMVLRLAGEFLPPGGVIQANGTRKPDYRLIDQFWNELKSVGTEYLLNIPDIFKKKLEIIKENLAPSEIILFGSRARGDFHRTSDIDIAVRTKENIEGIDLNGALDVVDLSTASDSLLKIIIREGVRLYESP
ncbi:MAG: type III-B CRISPR module RAMP protein Cmr1 [Calditrichaeota bacterium]|nr:type III-B CRISPR module RAMP protein Cmr1 [Calditrichota bacterium]